MEINKELFLDNKDFISEIFGPLDKNIKFINKELGVNIYLKEDEIYISGQKILIELAEEVVNALIEYIKKEGSISISQIRKVIDMIKDGNKDKIKELLNYIVCINVDGKAVRPKTITQKNYIDLIEKNDIVFGIGPAGTGKTYLAMAMAVKAFKNNLVKRIILTRPAVEAGESLGFLPGDLQEKVDPYLRPLYDALFDLLGYENYERLFEKKLIEVAPLAYMRGRTLDNAFIILDEAQNTTNEQMKMFLTRLGYGSKAVVTGDITQTDLPKGKVSGLISAEKILKNIIGIGFIEFSKSDVVRHQLVQKIIEAYENYED